MAIRGKITKAVGFGVLATISGLGSSYGWSRWETAPRFDNNPHPPFPSAELAALDRDVQDRFSTTEHRDFGYWRIVQFTHDLYRPVTPRETADVAALRAQKLDVLFYTMGRNGSLWGGGMAQIKGPGFMTGPPNKLPLANDQSATYCEQGLIENLHLTSLSEPGSVHRHDVPELTALHEVGEQVFSHFADSPPALPSNDEWCALPHGNWKVVAAPVLASSQRCVDCHRAFDAGGDQIKLGNPLGAAIYAYRPLDESTTQASVAS